MVLRNAVAILQSAMEAAVATLPDPVSSSNVQSIAQTILRSAKEGERDPIVLHRLALLELQLHPVVDLDPSNTNVIIPATRTRLHDVNRRVMQTSIKGFRYDKLQGEGAALEWKGDAQKLKGEMKNSIKKAVNKVADAAK